MTEDARINDIRVEKENGTEVYILDPFNSANIEITESEVNAILNEYGIPCSLQNFALYKRAFIHKSYVKKPEHEFQSPLCKVSPQPANCKVGLKSKSNDRLEFIGDGILECIIKYYLYKRFPEADEGFMTDTKIALVKNDSLGQIILEMGLEKWYIISKNAELKNTRRNVKKLGNLFEAFIGAIFLDFNKIEVEDSAGWFRDVFHTGPGFQMAQIFITNIVERHVNWSKILETNDNYKNQLQVLIQKEFKCVPHYLEISNSTENGFQMGAYLCLGQSIFHLQSSQAIPFEQFQTFANIHQFMFQQHRVFILLGQGQHKIKKKAEQLACSQALQMIRQFADTTASIAI